MLDYRVYHPQLHTDEAGRWDYRIEITYRDFAAASHEEEIARELFPDAATRKREENRRWEVTVNHWDLPIYQVDTTKSRWGARAQPPAQPAAPPPPTCTRSELQAAVDSYVAAQKAGDVSKLAFADKVAFRENMTDVAKSDGLWNKALPIALSRSFLDATRCKTFIEVIVTEGDHPYLKYSSAEDWSAPKPEARVSGQELINAANSYLDLSSDKFVKTPWGRPCADSHTFRLVNGKISNVHTLSVNLSGDRPSAENGALGHQVDVPICIARSS